MPTRIAFALLALLLLALPARAQGDDEPIPYPEEDAERPAPTLAAPPARFGGPAPEPAGIGVQLLGGALLLSSARAELAEPAFAAGARVEWEAGRLFSDEVVREGLFLDAGWLTAQLHGGTERYFAQTRFHVFTLAPAWEIHLGNGKDFAFYVQAGAGLVLQAMSTSSAGTVDSYSGTHAVAQYGIGLRGRPLLGAGPLRVALRLELTRFRRRYLDDTLLAAGVGAAF